MAAGLAGGAGRLNQISAEMPGLAQPNDVLTTSIPKPFQTFALDAAGFPFPADPRAMAAAMQANGITGNGPETASARGGDALMGSFQLPAQGPRSDLFNGQANFTVPYGFETQRFEVGAERMIGPGQLAWVRQVKPRYGVGSADNVETVASLQMVNFILAQQDVRTDAPSEAALTAEDIIAEWAFAGGVINEEGMDDRERLGKKIVNVCASARVQLSNLWGQVDQRTALYMVLKRVPRAALPLMWYLSDNDSGTPLRQDTPDNVWQIIPYANRLGAGVPMEVRRYEDDWGQIFYGPAMLVGRAHHLNEPPNASTLRKAYGDIRLAVQLPTLEVQLDDRPWE